MLKNDISAIEEQFNQECTVIELKYEYPGYTGIEKYAIVSSLSQKEIETRFPEQARSYSPFLVLDISFLDVRRDYRNNNKKYEMRSIRSESVFGFNDSDTETHHKEIYVPDFVEQWIENYELKEAIKQLTDKERDRFQQIVIQMQQRRPFAVVGSPKGRQHRCHAGSDLCSAYQRDSHPACEHCRHRDRLKDTDGRIRALYHHGKGQRGKESYEGVFKAGEHAVECRHTLQRSDSLTHQHHACHHNAESYQRRCYRFVPLSF